MPEMAYTARTVTGEIIRGRIGARSADDARNTLGLDNLEVLSVAPVPGRSGSWLSMLPVVGQRGIRTTMLASFTGQLALMLKTGTPLVESLVALEEQTEHERLARILRSLRDEIRGGSNLSDALATHPAVFDGYFVSAVRGGEVSGRLPEVFDRLERDLQKRVRIRSSIVSALIYPAIVTVLALSAVAFIVTFVLPKFMTIFNNAGVALPAPTRMLIAISYFTANYWYLILAVLVIVPTGVYLYVKSPRGGPVLDRLVLRLPLLGNLSTMFHSAMLLRTMGNLLESGVPLLECLDVARQASRNTLFRRFVRDASASVNQGDGLASAFEKSDLMSPTIKQMVATGERTGNLALVMNTVSDFLEEKTDGNIKRLSAMVEPLIIVVMGIVIGFIAVSVLLPLFRLTSAVRGGG